MFNRSLTIVKHILCLLLALWYFQGLQAQSYTVNIQKLSVEDGLSNRFVKTIYKDSRGFIWIGTQNGLNRYDGYTFKRYTTSNSTLVSNTIIAIYEDDQHRLWINHSNAFILSILDLQTNSISNFSAIFEGSAPFNSKDIKELYSNARNEIWINTKKGDIYRYRKNRFELIFSMTEKSLIGPLIQADSPFFWLVKRKHPYDEHILKLNLQGEVTDVIDLPDSIRVGIMGFDKNQSLWLLEQRQKKLFKIDKNNALQSFSLQSLDLPEAIFLPNRYDTSYLNPFNGSLWWYHKVEQAYFYVSYPREGIVVNLQAEMEPFFTYRSPIVTSIYFAAEDQTWVATEDGIFIITLKKNKFTTLLAEKSETNSIRGMVTDRQGTLYINTFNRRVHIAPENSKTIQDENRIWWGAARDREGHLWFGEVGQRIEQYNPLNRQSRYYHPVVPDPASQDWLQYSFLSDKTGRLWIGFNMGLHVLEPGTDSYQRFTRFNTFERLEKSSIYHLQEDEKGIWIASSSGLYLLEPGKGITRRYATDEKPPYRLPHDHLLHFYKDKEGFFWLASQGGGLIRFTPEDGSYRQFTTTDGLSSNTIYAVYEDDYGRLWLPSEYGLMVLDRTNYEVQTYLKSDGIAHNEFNTLSHYRADDGHLYFGGLSGVTVVDPKNFTVDAPAPAPLRINSCQVLNGKTGELTDKTTAVRRSEVVQLSPSDKSLLLDFALLNYENSRKNSYIYTIEGLDKAWTPIEGNTNLRINDLPYGSYIVRIKGQDIKGTVSANELAIPIVVKKPFYRRNGFILTAVFALGLLIYGAFRWRLQQLQHTKNRLEQTVVRRTMEIQQQKDKIEADKNTIAQQAEKLRELDGVKSRFFANISHELRTPLTLILGPLSNLLGTLKTGKSADPKSITQPLTVMQRNGKKLLQLIEEILDLSKLEAHKMEVQESTVVFYSFIKRLFVTFESHAAHRNIRYQPAYKLDNDIQLVLDSDKTGKIITNFLSNAFKYSPDGASISLSVTAEDTFIRVAVHDTGPGIHPDDLPHIFDRFYQSKQADAPVQGGTGIGLALCKELATLMGGEVHVESQWGKGSTFSYTWPKKEPTTPLTGLPPTEEPIQTAIPEALPAFSETPHPETTPTGTATEEPVHPTETHTILVVEDHRDMRDFIVEILRPHYRIQTAGDGEKALALLEDTASLPDLMLSDVMMPNMDGFTLLHHIKAHPVWRTIPVVLLTARAAQQDRLQALGIGVDDYLTKPFDAKELLARIRNLLNNYRERKQWQQKESVDTPLTLDFGEKPERWDTKWLEHIRDIVKREIINDNYKVPDLAAELHISHSQLLMKMKQLTGLTPHEFIREIKLQKARVLLENSAKSTIAEVAYAAGFNTPNYFSIVYENRFGKRPVTYFSDDP